MNRIPIRNAGPATVRDQESIYHWAGGFDNIDASNTAMYTIPAKIKATPPTISRLHDTIRTTNRISVGMLCINKPATVPQKPKFISKISRENIARNRRNSIDSILGVQYTDLSILLFILYGLVFGGQVNTTGISSRIARCLSQCLRFHSGPLTGKPSDRCLSAYPLRFPVSFSSVSI